MLTGRVVMVTGAGGSIASQLVVNILKEQAPKRLVLLDICEYNLYRVQMLVESLRTDVPVEYLIADVRHDALIEHICKTYSPNVVFHTAALKHVPMLETPHNALEGIRTNVMGTDTAMKYSLQYGADIFVLVSTDKAVLPISMMGATKTFAEKICEGTAKERVSKYSKVAIVRFGNVIGSSGSVIPLFKEQIEAGGPVTVTDPGMVRFFMSIEQATQLMLDAANLAMTAQNSPVDTYVLDMGEPVRIHDLALQLIAQSGKDVSVKFIGPRKGEKLEELLWDSEYELAIPTRVPGVLKVIQQDRPHLSPCEEALPRLREAVESRDFLAAESALRDVTGYVGNTIVCETL